MTHEAIERFVVHNFGDPRHNAALFSQYTAYNLRPRHIGEFVTSEERCAERAGVSPR